MNPLTTGNRGIMTSTREKLGCTALATAAILLVPGQAHAASISVQSRSAQVKAGSAGKLTLSVRAAAPMTCGLVITRGKTKSSSKTVRANRSRLVWSYQVPRTSRRGKATIKATCTADDGSKPKTVGRALHIKGKRNGTSLVATRIRARRVGSLLGDTPPAEETPKVGDRPTSGQCTVWAGYKRPDLGIYGDAHTWDDEARSMGFLVDGTPQVGDIAVWEAGNYGASSLGHVAYVEVVEPGGTIHVSEFNWAVFEGYGERSGISPAGLEFIHRK